MPSFASPPSRQLFSVPFNFVLYITENPSTPEFLEKLLQTCKYFFSKNPILIFPRLVCHQNGCAIEYGEKFIPKTNAKFWLSSSLSISGPINLQKFYRFSPKSLFIYNYKLSLKEFDLIVAENSLITFDLFDGGIKDATIDVVLQKLKNVENFMYNNPEEIYSVETLRKIYFIQKIRNLKFCGFRIYAASQIWHFSVFAYLREPELEFRFYTYGRSAEEFAEEIQRKNPNIFDVEVLSDCVSVKFL